MASRPQGVGARNLAGMPPLQAGRAQSARPAMQAFLHHLDLLAKREFAALRRACGVDEDDLADMIAEIRRLDPSRG